MPLYPYVALDVALALDGGQWATPSGWLTISDPGRVRAFATRRGRRGRGQPEPAETVLTMGTSDGWLTPGSGVGPYQALLTAGRQLRVTGSIISEPGMETGEAVWAAGPDAVATRSALVARTDAWSLAIARTATAGDAAATAGPAAKVNTGETVDGLAWVRGQGPTARAARVGVTFYDAAGAVISTVWGATTVVSLVAWSSRAVSAVAPALADTAALVVEYQAADVADVLHVDDVALMQPLAWGVVETWPTAQAGHLHPDATADIVAVDAVGAAGATPTARTVAVYEARRGVRYPRPRYLWLLAETETGGAVSLVDEMAGAGAAVLGRPELAGSGLVPYSDIAGVQGSEAANAGAVALPAFAALVAPWTYAAVARVPNDDAARPSVSVIRAANWAANGYVPAQLSVAGSGSLIAIATTAAGGLVSTPGGGVAGDDVPHLLAVRSTGTAMATYLDGVLVGSVAHGALKDPLTVTTLNAAAGSGTAGGDIAIAMLTVWAVALTAGELANYWADISSPWADDTASARATRLGNAFLAPGAITVLAGGLDETALPARLDRRGVWALLEPLADGAHALIVPLRSGRLEWRRRQVGPPAAPRWTWAASAEGVTDLEIAGSGSEAISTAVVASEAGAEQAHTDTGIVPARRWSLSGVPLAEPVAVWTRAEREVFTRLPRGDWPERVVIRLASQPTALAIDPGDRADVAWQPPFAAAPLVAQCLVTEVAHEADGAGLANWQTTVGLVLARPERRALDALASTGGASTPDSAALSPAGSLDVRARLNLATPDAVGTYFTVATKYGTASVLSWYLAVLNRQVYWYVQDQAGTGRFVLAPGLGHPAGRPFWIRGVADADADQLRVYMSDDGQPGSWVLLGSAAAVGLVSIRDTASPVEVGVATVSGVAQLPLVGYVFHVEIRNGIDDTAPVLARFDPLDAASLTDPDWPAVGTVAGEVWTRRATGALINW